MARFDVYRYPRARRPDLLLDVQADLLSHISTRVVVPLVPGDRDPGVGRGLNPIFRIGDEPFVMLTPAIAAVPRRDLGKPVASLRDEHDAITRALDLLLTGF